MPSFPLMRALPLRRASLLLCLCGLSAWPLASAAGNLYKFQDKDGNILLTNQVDGARKPLHGDARQYHRLVKVTWYPDTNVHRYGNWGDGEAAVKPSASRNRNAFDDIIRQAASRHHLDFGLVKAVIHTESGFDPRARSGPGAQGLMQLMPATAARYKVDNVWDPAQNIEAGSRHLRYLLTRYGDLSKALAAYNAGEGNVDKYGGIPPFAETQDYVRRVTGRFSRLYGGDGGMTGTGAPQAQAGGATSGLSARDSIPPLTSGLAPTTPAAVAVIAD